LVEELTYVFIQTLCKCYELRNNVPIQIHSSAPYPCTKAMDVSDMLHYNFGYRSDTDQRIH